MKILYNQKGIEMKRLDRREALKLMGLGGASLLTGSTSASAATKLSAPSSKKRVRIVIAGGGTGGMIAAARLRRSAPNAQITLIAPNETHLYQSGQVYVAAGLYNEYDNKRRTADLLPDGVAWLREKVTAFDPDTNKVEAEKSGEIPYDYLVVALGCEYDFSRIEGLQASDIGKNGITSVYLNDLDMGDSKGAIVTEMWLKSIRIEAAKKKVNILLADPDTPVKGEGASLDMLFLCNDLLKGNGPKKGEDLHKNAAFTLAKASKTLFRLPQIDNVLSKQIKLAGNIKTALHHTLKAVDTGNKIATFSTKGEELQVPYDYLHITPPMQAPEVLRSSKLAAQEGTYAGWLEADEATLQHPRYKNVFGIGDILGIDTGKSGGAAREQGIIIQDNIAADMEGQPLPMKYNGYSVTPFRTRYGKEILAEYNATGLAPTFPLDPSKARWLWWAVDLHLMRSAYFNLMMRGMM